MIVTIIAPHVYVSNTYGLPNFLNMTLFSFIYGLICMSMVNWLAIGVLFLSFVRVRKSKHNVSIFLLLISTIAYVFLFVYSYYMLFADNGEIWIYMPNCVIYWMIPTWIIAGSLEWLCKNEESTQEQMANEIPDKGTDL